jgi:hypothetical protein
MVAAMRFHAVAAAHSRRRVLLFDRRSIGR